MIVIYDIETFPNLYSLSYSPKETDELFFLYVSTLDEDPYSLIQNFVEHIDKMTHMVGYNNIAFDAPVAQHAYQLMRRYLVRYHRDRTSEDSLNFVSNIIMSIYDKAQEVINGPKKFYSNWKYQLDLFRIQHFDNPAKSTSLKALQIAMNYPNVMDMPVPHNHVITSFEEIEMIKEYNFNDVLSTKMNYEHCSDKIRVRRTLGQKYDLDLMNLSDSSLGEKVILHYLSKEMSLSIPIIKNMRSSYTTIPGKDLTLPYVNFEQPIFKKLKKEIEESIFDGEEPSFKKDYFFGGSKIVNGIGGIHGCTKPGRYVSDKEYVIVSVDVISYYPKLSIVNEFYPSQFGKAYCRVLELLFKDRMSYPKGTDENGGLKVSINAAYGKTGSKHSPLRDVKYMLTTTINGQLSLLMLAEKLYKYGELLMLNTDGLEIRIKRKDYLEVLNLCKEWEKLTKLSLEYNDYDQLIIRDVNNYTCIDVKGKIKRKGEFEINKELHKDPSLRIVSIALDNYFYKNIPFEESLLIDKDFVIDGKPLKTTIYDFCLRVKGIGDIHYDYHELIDGKLSISSTQKNIRYYISNKGGRLIKVYADKREEFVNVNRNQTLFNKYVDGPYDLDYSFYLKECNKIKEIIEPPQYDLFL